MEGNTKAQSLVSNLPEVIHGEVTSEIQTLVWLKNLPAQHSTLLPLKLRGSSWRRRIVGESKASAF